MNGRGVSIRLSRVLHQASDALLNASWMRGSSGPVLDSATLHDRWIEAHAAGDPEVSDYIDELGFRVDPDWLAELGRATQVTTKESISSWDHARLLYALVCSRSANMPEGAPMFILETGTAIGFSSVVAARALIDMKRCGVVISIDIINHEVARLWNTREDSWGWRTRRQILARWPRETQRILFLQGVLPDVLRRISIERVHVAFIDGEHSENSVHEELAYLDTAQGVGDLILIDDAGAGGFVGVKRALSSWATLNARDLVVRGPLGSKGLMSVTRKAGATGTSRQVFNRG